MKLEDERKSIEPQLDPKAFPCQRMVGPVGWGCCCPSAWLYCAPAAHSAPDLPVFPLPAFPQQSHGEEAPAPHDGIRVAAVPASAGMQNHQLGNNCLACPC